MVATVLSVAVALAVVFSTALLYRFSFVSRTSPLSQQAATATPSKEAPRRLPPTAPGDSPGERQPHGDAQQFDTGALVADLKQAVDAKDFSRVQEVVAAIHSVCEKSMSGDFRAHNCQAYVCNSLMASGGLDMLNDLSTAAPVPSSVQEEARRCVARVVPLIWSA